MWKIFDRDRQATDDNIIRRMRFACWITKATDTHSEYVILIAIPQQQLLRQCYVIRTLPLLLTRIDIAAADFTDESTSSVKYTSDSVKWRSVA
jgi:hypothetical protein